MSRTLTFAFSIPFEGPAADTCERIIEDTISRSLLNSLSEVHEDIGVQIISEVKDENVEGCTRYLGSWSKPGPDRGRRIRA
jgi:hypothetical protein